MDWGGYPRSLHAVLALIAEVRARHVVLLSGDRHLSSVSSLWLKTELDLADRRWVCERALGEASRTWQTHVDA